VNNRADIPDGIAKNPRDQQQDEDRPKHGEIDFSGLSSNRTSSGNKPYEYQHHGKHKQKVNQTTNDMRRETEYP
jgi:hypothetical protein